MNQLTKGETAMRIKKLLKNRKTIFISWIASYALFMIVPILIGIFIYNQSVKVITDEVNHVHYASLNQLKMIMDTKQREIENIGTKLLINDRIRNTMEIRESLTTSQGYSLVEIQKELINYKVSNDFIEDMYIYFKYNDFVLSNKSKYNSKDISYITQLDFNMTKEEWLDYINISRYNKYMILKTDNGDTKTS